MDVHLHAKGMLLLGMLEMRARILLVRVDSTPESVSQRTLITENGYIACLLWNVAQLMADLNLLNFFCCFTQWATKSNTCINAFS